MIRKWIVLTIPILIFQISVLFAHPPSAITLDFDQKTHLLEIKYDHKVRDATQHYIVEVKVQLNEKEIIVQSLRSQDDLNGGMVVYKILDAKSGDRIGVELRCVLMGSKTASIKIE